MITFSAHVELKRIPYRLLPGWGQSVPENAILPFKRSCERILKLKPSKRDPRRTEAWKRTCVAAKRLPDHPSRSQALSFITDWFVPYKIKGSPGLFTGYFEPSFDGSEKRTAEFRVPLYGTPKKVKRVNTKNGRVYRQQTAKGLQRLPTREEISKGPMLKNAPVLAWVRNKVDRYFLQVQGSGSIITAEGKKLLLGYDSQNGYPYTPVGRVLVAQNEIPKEKISMQSIREWMAQHPDRHEEMLNHDQSFVFFRKVKARNPIGAQSVELTPGRSIAVDRRYIPLGSLLWLDTALPQVAEGEGTIKDGAPFRRLMVAQDTGGAIKGAVRGDVFWGHGGLAEWFAGHMQSHGNLYLLLPKHLHPNTFMQKQFQGG